MSAVEFYLITLGVLACLNAISALGFNLQFGHAGIVNLAWILLVSAGAYLTAIAAVGPAPHNAFTTYIGGFGWPFPWDVLFGVGATTLFAALLGVIALRRLRADYLALALFAILEGMLVLFSDDSAIFNGGTGMTSVPGPWEQQLSSSDFQIVFLIIALVAFGLTYWVIARVTASPLGRAFHAIREDEEAAASLGRNTWRIKMVAFMIGGAAAGLSGALTVVYASGWSPSAWAPAESLAILGAVIIGGRGRNLGAVVGAVLVFGVIVQGATFLPQLGSVIILPELQSMFIGVLLLLFLWFRPAGILPERKERFAHQSTQGDRATLDTPVGAGASTVHGGITREASEGERQDVADPPLGHNPPAIRIDKLTCSYSGVQAIRGISLEIAKGSFVGIIGPNGAGKSTLLDCMSGRNREYKGSIFASAQDITRRPLSYVANLGIIRTFQVARPFARMTVLSNVVFGARRQRGEGVMRALVGGWKTQERQFVSDAWSGLERFDLSPVADNLGSELSGGQERLVELSRATMSRPDILLLDEPFAGVSPANRAKLADHLVRLWNGGEITVVMVEHRLEWVDKLCSRVIVMAEGAVLADGTMADVRKNDRVLEAYLGTP